MANLHGLLVELGLADPEMHPEREVPHDDWVVDRPFVPDAGQCYELAYGKVILQGHETPARVRIRADGDSPSQWIDLENGQVIDPALQTLPVRAYRPISNSSAPSFPR